MCGGVGTSPGFLTRADRECPALATFAAVDWLPLAELEEGGPVLPVSLDTRVVLYGYDLGWAQADGELTARAVMHLDTAEPDAMFVYLDPGWGLDGRSLGVPR